MRIKGAMFFQSIRTSFIIMFLLYFAGSTWALENEQAPIIPLKGAINSIKAEHVTTGMLYDKVVPLSEIHLFDGRAEAKTLDLIRWKQIFFELKKSSIKKPFLPAFESLKERARHKYMARGVIPIAILDLKYNTIKKEIQVSDAEYERGLKTREFSASDFDKNHVFAASTLKPSTWRGEKVIFVLDPSYYFSNKNRPAGSIQIDFGDGKGSRQVEFGENISVSYASTGEKTVSLTAVDEEGNPLVSRFIFDVRSLSTPDPQETWNIQSELPYQGETASGRAYIYRADDHPDLVSPVIVVEGFDMFNSMGWDEFYGYMNREDMLEKMRCRGRDLVVLDFDNSIDYLQRNAFLLVRLIEIINAKESLQTPLVIAGACMGGLVARYALAYMEQMGIDHNTRTFISFDVPHQGANIPLGLQHWVQFFSEHSAQAEEMLEMLKSPAARQMLIYHSLQTDGTDASCDPQKTAFINDINRLGGYPKNLRKVAIANGSGYGQGLAFNPGDQLIRYEYSGWVSFLGFSVFVEITGNAWAVPDSTPETMIFEGRVLEDSCNIDVAGTRPFDNAPGGKRGTTQELADVTPPYGKITAPRPDHCFIPTISALDIDTTDPFYNIAGDSRIADKTPFDEIYFADENQEHVDITPEIAEWFIKEINYGNGFIVDHHCKDISRIPDSWIEKAKGDLRIGYSHTSHGSQIVTGMTALRGTAGSKYYYTSSDWGASPGLFLNDYWACDYAGDLGHNGDLNWYDATVIMLDNLDNDRNVVMWSWCGGVSDNTEAGIDAYLDAMDQLEQDYPGITFVYMTGHLDGTGSGGNLHKMNERIRNYCRDNGKVLFDFADIESYDPDGILNYMHLMADDNCDYDSNLDGVKDKNWAGEWITANPGTDLTQTALDCDACAHSHRLNCVLKGRAFWWMMARIAGWNPDSSAGKLYYPHIAGTGVWETEVCVINTSDSQTINGLFKAYSDAGELVSEIDGVTLPPHGRREITVGDEFADPASIGYIIFESDSDTVAGYTKFYTPGRYRVAIPAVSEINTGDIYITHIASDANWGTGISLLNTTSSPKTLTIEFDNGEDKTVELGSREHKAFMVRSLFGEQAQPGIHSAVVKDASGVIGLELFTNSPGNQMSGILLKDDTTTRIYYPHIASTGGWGTGIVAYNPSDSDCDITVTPYTETGTALTPVTDTIGGKQQYMGLVTALGLPVETAWIEVETENPITGFELFARTNQLAGYTGVGISSTEGIFAKIEKEGGTGIAFVNIEENPAVVTLTAYDDSGAVIATETVNLDAREKILGIPESIFTGDISSATYIGYSSDRETVGFQLNASSDGMMLDALPGL